MKHSGRPPTLSQATSAAFLGLIGKVLPMTIAGTGESGGIVIEVVKFADTPTQ